jgi:hypothetical protein
MCVVAERSVIESAASSVPRDSGGIVLTVKPGREPSGGVIRSENVDMSSDKQGERPCRRKSKGSCLKLI